MLVAVGTAEVAKVIAIGLSQAGFTAMIASTDDEAMAILNEIIPELAVVDARLCKATEWVLAEGTGPRASVLLFDRGATTPEGFPDGRTRFAMRKPFSMVDLIEVLSRGDEVSAKEFDGHLATECGGTLQEFGPLIIDLSKQMVFRKGSEREEQGLELSPAEFRMLRFFSANRDRCFTRAEILRGVWGGAALMEERTVDVHVVRLRRALEPLGASSLIRTVRGVGYAAGVSLAS